MQSIKAILTCTGLKKTVDGWVFRDVQTLVRSITESSNFGENSFSFTSKSKFQRYVMDQFKRTSKRILKLEKSVFWIKNKVDELIENYIDSSSSKEESDDDEDSNEEDFMDESNL